MRLAFSVCACLLACLVPAVPANAGTAERKMVERINKTRAHHGLAPLRTSPSLSRSANRFAYWLMAHDVFGHRARVSANRKKFRRLGEALAMHSGRRRRVARTVHSWLGSPAHRALVLTRSHRWIGTGMVRGRFGGRRHVIWVLQVGAR